MELRFLCSRQRQQLLNDSALTFETWSLSLRKALVACYEDRLGDAFEHAGRALEAAQLLNQHHARIGRVDLQRFTDSAILLCMLLKALGEGAIVPRFLRACCAHLETVSTGRAAHGDFTSMLGQLRSIQSTVGRLEALTMRRLSPQTLNQPLWRVH